VELVSARRDVAFVIGEFRFSERPACRLLDLDGASYRYESRPDHNEKVREALLQLARQKPRFGYRRLCAILTRRLGWSLDPKRVHRFTGRRASRSGGFRRKRVIRTVPTDSPVTRPNQEWALDFVHDSVANGRSIRALTVVDVFTRKCPSIEVGINHRVAPVLP
jgi:putative transposase